tara:strand:+ start:27686 stop:29683 length:1998 start_codon:yes stop_codon:yes gene_type:complete
MAVEVFQSEDSASKFNVEVCGKKIVLIFLTSSKGRMDFSAEMDGVPQGKVNVLSQHSITRLSKDVIADVDKAEFKTKMLEVGIAIRDNTYTPAPEKILVTEIEKYSGMDSTLGVVGTNTINKFMSDDLLLDKVNTILHQSRNVPFVGDDANLILTFLVMLSCKTTNPLNLEMIGQSSAGKTFLTLTARNGFPKSMCMVLAGASREALKYDYDEIDEDGNFIVHVDGKCIVILEKDESYAFVQKMKPLMSGDDAELIWKTPVKNDLTGEIETRDFIIRGQPSFITLTTKNPKEQEQITRQLLMTPDTTSDKVQSVVRNSLRAKARPEEFQVHPNLDLLKASMLSLDRYRVRNIFAPLMADFFPSRNAQHQRDITKVLSLIDSITLLHQHQRPIDRDGEDVFLMSTIEDNLIGLILADLVLRASLSGVPDDSWLIFTEMSEMNDSKRALTIDNILQWMHLHAGSVTKNSLKEKHLPTLEDAGLIEVSRTGGGRGGGRKTYRIVNTRKGLMDSHALSPLFIESVRRNLENSIEEFDDIIRRCERPKRVRKLEHGENAILKNMGCKTKEESLVWRSLFLPTYFRKQNIGSTLSKIVGKGKQHDLIFSGKSWLDSSLEDKATVKLETKREVKTKVQESSKLFGEKDSADIWEAIAEDHLEPIWDDVNSQV